MNPRLIIGLAAVLVIGACGEQNSTAPNETPQVAAAAGQKSPSYVISYSAAQAGDLNQAIERAGGKARKVSPAAGLATAVSSDAAFADRLRSVPGVRAVTRDTVIQWVPRERVTQASIGDDEPFFGFQWAPKAVHAPEAWDAGATGRGARVAVLDGGLNNTHIDLKGNVDVQRSASFWTGLAFNQDEDPDHFSHATHVAGIIAAQNDQKGTIGIAPNATIIGVKVLHQGSGSFGQVIEGILYAATPTREGGGGADIINMSLGATVSSGNDVKLDALVAALDQATTYAHERGVLVIASAGNGDRVGNGIDHDLGNWTTIPAQSAHVLGVSALGPVGFATGATNFDRLASYSNFGLSIVDFSGPGGDFVLFPADGWFLDMVLSPATRPENNGYFFAAGTSMSAPAVAAVAALIIGEKGRMSPDALAAALAASADDLGASGTDAVYGMGRVNAFKAVQ
ncbi:MAG TPA: S8 family serine peptidase [Gemmatimonadales bacterium]|nr:S8 family serine peptidase [Gemmatimonadales bacterium]